MDQRPHRILPSMIGLLVVLLATQASSVVIDNDRQSEEEGYWSVDVSTGGECAEGGECAALTDRKSVV